MKDFWNERYNDNEWAYGKAPNTYIKEKLPLFNAGKVLFPAEGEGRNAVYAATLGWNVSAFDYSLKGKEKADKLAQLNNVTINYKVQAFLDEKYKQDEFDMICLTFVHFEPKIKAEMHKRLNSYLKKGGYIILEAFSKEHREINKKNPKVGGPSSEEEMYSLEEIKRDFSNYEIIELKNKNTYLQEGLYHIGNSAVIRFIGKKK
ncbi:class I SAM-dependent methyltransferase [Tenacibaculum aiptasiae]|uniref:class I SAM-dependent methyltransferase n=1 Tax=Tenacibaculum aiptasiae TaxID=426481 RepID=UPI003B5C57B7